MPSVHIFNSDPHTVRTCGLKKARVYLDNILLLRDTMIKHGLMRCFTVCMNLIGIEGNFHQDYSAPLAPESVELMREMMHSLGEI